MGVICKVCGNEIPYGLDMRRVYIQNVEGKIIDDGMVCQNCIQGDSKSHVTKIKEYMNNIS